MIRPENLIELHVACVVYVCVCVLCLAHSTAFANDGMWQIVEMRGNAMVRRWKKQERDRETLENIVCSGHT